MTNSDKHEGASMADKSETQRQIDNDAIAREYLDIVKARAERMKIGLPEALAATFYILMIDYMEARRVGESTFVGEFDSRRGKKGKRQD
jgi:hypothetical protein